MDDPFQANAKRRIKEEADRIRQLITDGDTRVVRLFGVPFDPSDPDHLLLAGCEAWRKLERDRNDTGASFRRAIREGAQREIDALMNSVEAVPIENHEWTFTPLYLGKDKDKGDKMSDTIWGEMRESIEREIVDFGVIKQTALEITSRAKDSVTLGHLSEIAQTCGAHIAYLEVKLVELESARENDRPRPSGRKSDSSE